MIWPEPRRAAWVRGGVIAALTAALIAIHFATPATPAAMHWHALHRHLLYLPIILAAFWFGWPGGGVLALVVSLLYFPHLVPGDAAGAHAHHPPAGPSLSSMWLLDSINYLWIGILTGWLAQRLENANRDLRRQSAQLRTAMEDLRVRTREVFAAEEQLRRADRLTALGQLTAGLAHEIRNPLGSIRGAAEIMADPDLSQAQREEFSRVMMEETERLDKVLASFLAYARDQRQGEDEACQVAAAVERTLTLLDSRLHRAGVQVELDLEPECPSLAMPEALLQQVLLNILLNSIQAMPDGGRIVIQSRRDGARCTLTITDSGTGIPPEVRPRVFDPFFTTKPSGTGLGLAIVHKIVTGQRGTVDLDPAMERGARVILSLPAVDA